VIKIPRFTGRLSPRALYIYLPRGYAEHQTRRYPVLYMHDGQNCFEAYAADSFAGSWQADRTADRLIGQGRMRECLIVGVSNGGRQRRIEYLPPYATYQAAQRKGHQPKPDPVTGTADRTLAYYQADVATFIQQTYRVLGGREQTATCGSSLGGLFSTYIAWEQPEFARHHAIMSPSYWLTRTPQDAFETIERLRQGPPRDLRLWLDSGTLDAPGRGNDGMPETLAARQALLDIGYQEGPDFRYYLAKGAIHHESAWAARLPLVFEFLFPFS
jgi:predicted alpha/beta superfamily hydrolase